MTSHVTVHLIYRVDFSGINSWLVVATLTLSGISFYKIGFMPSSFIQYLPLNVTVFLLNGFILKAAPRYPTKSSALPQL